MYYRLEKYGSDKVWEIEEREDKKKKGDITK
jgi:hypothetical protein